MNTDLLFSFGVEPGCSYWATSKFKGFAYFGNLFFHFLILIPKTFFAAWFENQTFIPTIFDWNQNILKLTSILEVKVDASHSQSGSKLARKREDSCLRLRQFCLNHELVSKRFCTWDWSSLSHWETSASKKRFAWGRGSFLTGRLGCKKRLPEDEATDLLQMRCEDFLMKQH